MRVGIDDVLANGRSQTTTTAEAEHEDPADNAVEVELVEWAINAATEIYSIRSPIRSNASQPG